MLKLKPADVGFFVFAVFMSNVCFLVQKKQIMQNEHPND
jgi:hypothetical protein